jgi:hypothetical protein
MTPKELMQKFPMLVISPVVIWYKGYDVLRNQYGHYNIRLDGEGIDAWSGSLNECLQVIDQLKGKPEKAGVNICGGW